MYSAPKREGGVALITAMLITALVSVIAVGMVARQQLDIRRTANVLDNDQAYLYALGLESWGMQILARDASRGPVDHGGEDWAQGLAPIAVEGGAVSGDIQDLQGRYNLNNLLQDGAVNQLELQRLRRLLGALEVSPELADAVADWLDTDLETRFPNGAEDNEYLLAQPPYRAADGPMVSVSELRLVKGFDAETYSKVAPYVTVLPRPTAVNVNTASPPVLMALAEGITRADAEALAAGRGTKGYQDVTAFLGRPELAGRGTDIQQGITVSSQYFLLHAHAEVGRGRSDIYSVVARPTGGTPAVLTRSWGMY